MDPYTRQALALAVFALPGLFAAGRLVILLIIDPAADLVNYIYGAPRPPRRDPADLANGWNVNGYRPSKDGDHGF